MEHCKANNEVPLKRGVFRNTFKQYNFGFHVPKKDKCNFCESVKQIGVENLDETMSKKYDIHTKEVIDCKKKFEEDQKKKKIKVLYVHHLTCKRF